MLVVLRFDSDAKAVIKMSMCNFNDKCEHNIINTKMRGNCYSLVVLSPVIRLPLLTNIKVSFIVFTIERKYVLK